MATATLILVTEGHCEFCGTGPTCGICGRDDSKKGGRYNVAQLSFLTASVREARDVNPMFQQCGGGVRVLRKKIG